MKRAFLLLVVLWGGHPFAWAQGSLKEGDTIPDLTLMTHQGRRIQVNSYAKDQGKRNLLLVFFRTGTCAVCLEQLREFSERHKILEGGNAAVLALSMDDAIVHARTSEKIQHRYPLLLDPEGKTVKAFGVWNPNENLAYPSLFLVGPDQKVLYRYVGRALRDRPPFSEVLRVIKHYSGQLPRKSAAGAASTESD